MREAFNKFLSAALIILVQLLMVSCSSISTKGLIEGYQTSEFKSHPIQTIAILPLPDDTEEGTLYATNYLYNKLVDKTEGIYIVDIAEIREIIDQIVIKRLEKYNSSGSILNDDDLYKELATILIKKNVDAIIYGEIHDVQHKSLDMWNNGPFTICDFSYYLTSLKDGKLLWKARIETYSETFFGESHNIGGGWVEETRSYPGVYQVIQSGIDEILKTFPFIKR